MANPEHLKVVMDGRTAIDSWRSVYPDRRLDLSGADLSQVGLSEADLSNANLIGANLSDANLIGANLSEANLTGAVLIRAFLIRANMIRAILDEANLIEADLFWADLREANFDGANLSFADLNMTRLMDADLTECRFDSTILVEIDLSEPLNIGKIQHGGPSHISVDTLVTTLRSEGGKFTLETEVFLLQAGVPQTLLEHLPGLLEANPIQFYSVFISYATEDESHATALYDDLKDQGVKVWKWDRDAVGGRGLRDNIDRAVRNYDKMVLICSESSLNSDPVIEEIERALNKEQSLNNRRVELEKEAAKAGEPKPFVDTDVLLPINLDDYVFGWDSPFASRLTRKVISDFTDGLPGSEKFGAAVEKLVRDLDPRSWPPSPPIGLSSN